MLTEEGGTGMISFHEALGQKHHVKEGILMGNTLLRSVSPAVMAIFKDDINTWMRWQIPRSHQTAWLEFVSQEFAEPKSSNQSLKSRPTD